MSEMTSAGQLKIAKEHMDDAVKAFAKRPAGMTKLRARADAAIKAFDRAEMKAVTQESEAYEAYMKTEVLPHVDAATKEVNKTMILDDSAPVEADVDKVRKHAKDVRFLVESDILVMNDIQSDIARTIKKAEEVYAAGKAAEAAIDEVEADLKAAGAKVVELHAKLGPLHAQALDAAKARDAAALSKAKTAFTATWEQLDEQWRTIEKAREQFIGKHLKGPISAGKREALETRLDAASKGQRDAAMAHQEAAKWAREVRQLEAAAVDGKKAASVLGLDTKEAGAVAEALQGDDSAVRKKLEALAKRIKSKVSGKEMFERLRKAKMA